MLRSQEMSIRLHTLAWVALVVLFLIGLPMLLAVSPLVPAAVFACGALLAVGMRWLWLRMRGRARTRRALGAAAAAGGLLLTGLTALPLYWLVLQPALNPLLMPRVTMTDGRRTLVFQGMAHIGSALFYRSVAFDMLRAREAGSVLYFEGVLGGTPEAKAWFDTAVGAGVGLNEDYARIARVCGLHFQNDFLNALIRDSGPHPERTVDADVSETEMMLEWQRLVAQTPQLADDLARAHAGAEGGPSGLDRVADMLDRVGPRQQPFVGAACRGLITYALGRPESPDVLNPVVLDFRNRKLAERVMASPADALYLVYGAGHLPGFVEELRRLDPAWKISGATWSTAIQSPDLAVGRLRVDPDALLPSTPGS